jgi:hypothetical protein
VTSSAQSPSTAQTSATLASKQVAKALKQQSPSAHSLGTLPHIHTDDRVLWLITLVLVIRQVMLERSGGISRNGTGVDNGFQKDNSIQMSNPNV